MTRRIGGSILMCGYRAAKFALRGTSAQEWRATGWVFQWVSRRAASMDADSVVEFLDSTFQVLPCDYTMLLALRSGSYESLMAAIFRRCAAPGFRVLDVGANIGLYTVLAAKCVGPSGLVVAVEPSSRALELLHTNLARNEIKDVVVVPVAAGDIDGPVQLIRPKGFVGQSSLSSPRRDMGAGNEHEDAVQARLDELLRGQAFDLIKIDVEGYEHHALRGMLGLLRPSSILFLEYSDKPDGAAMRALGSSMWPHVAVIDERRGRIRWTSWDNLEHTTRVNVVASSAGARLSELLAPWDRER